MAEFSSVAVYALLNGAWVDLSSYVQPHLGFNFRWGIFGERQDDILADTGEMRLSLKNNGGLFYPEGSSALSGWGAGVTLKLVYTYGGITYTRFKGHVPKEGLQLRVGDLAAMSYVDVTALDWMDYASGTPIITPDIQLSLTADEALELVKDYVPAPVSLTADTGDYTFPTIFDSTGLHTSAYTEMSKLAYSESPGRIYLIKTRQSGEALVFENSTHRDTPTQKTTVTLTEHYLLNSTGGYILNSTGGKIVVSATTEADPVAVTFNVDDDVETDNVLTDYGSDIVNYATVGATPKRIDTEPQILYRLPYPIPLAAGETYSFRAQYTDPQGGGRVNAIKSSMLAPEAPGAVDPYLKLLLHFTSDFTDSTGRHTVTNNDVTVQDDIYVDVGPEPDVQRINNNVLGPFAIFGGYATYKLSVPSSTDFEFEGGPFTVGFYANVLDNTTGSAVMARDGSTVYAPWRLGFVGTETMQIHMSSNATSWDIANAKSWGELKRNRWTHYEINRDADGWFYAFAGGQLTDTWYSALSFPANTNPLSIGFWAGGYMFMGLDELYIKKGQALHTSDFLPPERNLKTTQDGDYWLNTADDQTGTDLSDYLEINVNYFSNEVEYVSIKNTSSSAGYFYIQARGRGVYPYDKIEKTVYDIQSINANNYQTLNINQSYQQDLTAGTEWITAIVAADKDPRTKLRGIQFFANKSATNMLRFLQCDIGDLIRVIFDDLGIDGYYHIQNINCDMQPGNLVYVTWGLVPGNTP